MSFVAGDKIKIDRPSSRSLDGKKGVVIESIKDSVVGEVVRIRLNNGLETIVGANNLRKI